MTIWNKLTVREITEEEKEIFEDCNFMWEGPTPELFEKVLITTTKSVDDAYIDEWTEFDVGTGFEDTDVDLGEIIYWASIPEFVDEQQKEYERLYKNLEEKINAK